MKTCQAVPQTEKKKEKVKNSQTNFKKEKQSRTHTTSSRGLFIELLFSRKGEIGMLIHK